jgi:hypothetical protein
MNYCALISKVWTKERPEAAPSLRSGPEEAAIRLTTIAARNGIFPATRSCAVEVRASSFHVGGAAI